MGDIDSLKILMLVGVFFVLLGVIWYLDSGFRKDSSMDNFDREFVDVNSTSQDPPSELSDNFNPSANTAVFRIIKVDEEKRQMELEFLWPDTWEGKAVVSEIACKDGDIRFEKKSEKNLGNITFKKLGDVVKKTLDDYVIFYGKCEDVECSKMVDCLLYLGN